MTAPVPDKKSAFLLPIQKNTKILAIFAIVCTALVGLVNELTKDKIKAQAQQQLLNTLHSIIDPTRYDNEITQDCVSLPNAFIKSPANNSVSTDSNTNNATKQTAYIARKNGRAIAMAITSTAPDGYNGNIELIIAVNIDGSISGVRVLKHQETPGLGDKIERRKSAWITSFNDKTLLSEKDSRWAVAKDGGMFDQFTGATITPRAVVKAVKKAALYLTTNQEAILMLPNSCLLEHRAQTNTENESEVDDNHE